MIIKKYLNTVLAIALFSSVSLSLLAETQFEQIDTKLMPAKVVESSAVENKIAVDAAKSPDADIPAKTTLSEPAVFVHKVKGKMNKVYKRLFTGLENNGYYVIFEPNLGRNLAHSAKRWGKDYNKNNLDSIRSMVFCNGWYANKISNEDPNMLALCPLHVTLVHKDDITSVLFVKPGVISQGSTANSIALELEQDVIRIIKESAR